MQRFTLQQGLRYRAAEIGVQIVAEKNIQKVLRISAAAAAVVLLSGIILFIANRPATAKPVNTQSSTPAAAIIPTASTTPVLMEMHIANTGLTYFKGAKITSVSDDLITATVSWGATSFEWNIRSNALTRFFSREGMKQTEADLRVGDIVSVTGKLVSDSKLTLDAQYIRNE